MLYFRAHAFKNAARSFRSGFGATFQRQFRNTGLESPVNPQVGKPALQSRPLGTKLESRYPRKILMRAPLPHLPFRVGNCVWTSPGLRAYFRAMNFARTPFHHFLKRLQNISAVAFIAGALSSGALAQSTAPITLKINADQMTGKVSPRLYGLMTEEINYSYDGGLYGELVRNRTFKWSNEQPLYWHLIQENGGAGAMSLDTNLPLNSALSTSLKLEITKAGRREPVGVANDGFWGIPVRPNTKYRASFSARADKEFSGPIEVSIVSSNGATVFATGNVRRINGDWKKYEVTLTTGNVPTSADNQLRLTVRHAGTVWLSCVSLFPPTYNNRVNGNRPDIMQLLADMNPKFLRFPGGNYVEGNTFATRFDWKKTIGEIGR